MTDGTTPDIHESAKHYLDEYAQHTQQSTARNQRYQMQKYVEHLNRESVKSPSSMKVEQIVDFFFELGENGVKSAATMSKYQSMLTSYHDFLENKDRYDDPLVTSRTIKSLRVRDFAESESVIEPQPLTRDEIRVLLQAESTRRNELLVWLMYEMGLRLHELRNLRLSNLDLDQHISQVSGKTNRRVPFTNGLANHIDDYVQGERASLTGAEENDFVFPSRAGGQLSSSQVRRIVKSMAEQAGIQQTITRQNLGHRTDSDVREYVAVTPRILRYSIVGHLLSEQVPPWMISCFIGRQPYHVPFSAQNNQDDMFDRIRTAIETIRSDIDP